MRRPSGVNWSNRPRSEASASTCSRLEFRRNGFQSPASWLLHMFVFQEGTCSRILKYKEIWMKSKQLLCCHRAGEPRGFLPKRSNKAASCTTRTKTPSESKFMCKSWLHSRVFWGGRQTNRCTLDKQMDSHRLYRSRSSGVRVQLCQTAAEMTVVFCLVFTAATPSRENRD